MKSSAPAVNTSSAKATAVQTRFTNFVPFSMSMIFSPRWEFSRWDKLQSRCHKLSSIIAETLPSWVNLPAAELETITKMDARVVSPRSQFSRNPAFKAREVIL
jgi:hypothetical protein